MCVFVGIHVFSHLSVCGGGGGVGGVCKGGLSLSFKVIVSWLVYSGLSLFVDRGTLRAVI